ncbi:MAG: trypsin-like serine protease [Clostridiales bacterium]|nr:trypsin-like serine protease [Clostridiales bacterium]
MMDNDQNLNNMNNRTDNQYDNWSMEVDNSHQLYPTPQLSNQPKKKKRPISKILGFVAAALVFGIIAGAGTSAYHYFFQGGRERSLAININEDKDESKDETIQLENDGDTVANTIPTTTQTHGIITDVSDIVDKVMPSIVTINSTNIITQYDIFFGRSFSQPVAGSGSGIIIGQSESSILVVTNNHVVEDAEEIEIVFSDESTASATIKGSDVRSDLAVLEIDMKDISKDTLDTIRVARLGNSGDLKSGQMVIAIGNALGYGQSVTVGYVSALDREIQLENGITMKLIQTDAAINPGNSGGALLNINGEVIGINSLKFASEKVEGMGYAIPISDAIPMINLLMNDQALEVAEMGFMGINVETAQNVTKALSAQFNMPVGVYINDIIEDSPAETAGLRNGHIIVGYNDIKIETIDDLLNVLTYSRPGDEVLLKVKELREGEYVDKEIKLVLGKRP